MAYNINKSNGDLLVTVEDGTADLTSTSIALVGRNFAGYGEYLNENMIHMLENFASVSQPNSPLEGQLWYDSAAKLLKIYDGTSFVSSGGGIELDRTSTLVHYLTFVENDFGLPATKVSREKGLTFQPATGNFAINKAAASSSKLEINNGINALRTLYPPLPNTVVSVHGDDNSPIRILLDGYVSNSVSNTDVSPVITFRRGPLVGTAGGSAATLIGSTLGSIEARGHSGATLTASRASIRFVASQTYTGAANGTKIEFLATQDGTLVTEVKAIVHGNGDFEVKGDIIGFSLSDERLKSNIKRIDNALDKISRLEGVVFTWNEQAALLGKPTDIQETGLLASKVKEVLPQATQQKDSGFLAVNYEKLMGLVVEAIKELKDEVALLKNGKIA